TRLFFMSLFFYLTVALYFTTYHIKNNTGFGIFFHAPYLLYNQKNNDKMLSNAVLLGILSFI
ncbi:hypothetical protein ACWOBL_08290, partial [Gemella bergeri]